MSSSTLAPSIVHGRSLPAVPLGNAKALLVATALLLALGTSVVGLADAKVICNPEPQCSSGGGGSGPTIKAVSAYPDPVDLGGTTTFDVEASGGSSYSYAYSELPPGCSSSNTPALSCTPTAVGIYEVTIKVSDSSGTTTTEYPISVVPVPPSISSFSASPSTVETGQGTQFTVSASQGETPYTYSYLNLPTGCASSNTATLSCTPTAVGTWPYVQVTVTTADEGVAYATTTLTVTQGPSVVLTLTPTTVAPGSYAYVAASASGGSGNYKYAFYGPVSHWAGCQTLGNILEDCQAPQTSGSYLVGVTVTDKAGAQVQATAMVVVGSALYATVLVTDGPYLACNEVSLSSYGSPFTSQECGNGDPQGFTAPALTDINITVTAVGTGSLNFWFEYIANPPGPCTAGGSCPSSTAVAGHASASGSGTVTLTSVPEPLYPSTVIWLQVNGTGNNEILSWAPVAGNTAWIEGTVASIAMSGCPSNTEPSIDSGWSGWAIYFPQCSETWLENAFTAGDVGWTLVGVLAATGVGEVALEIAVFAFTEISATVLASYFDQGAGASVEVPWDLIGATTCAGAPSSGYSSWYAF